MDIIDKLDNIIEAEVKSLLKHKMKKLKDKHGYVSSSMLTKKEKQQLKKNENILATIGGIGKMSGKWGERLGTFGTVLFKALKDKNIEVIDLKPIGKFDNEITVSYKGKQKKIKLTGNISAEKVVKKIIGK